MRRIAYLAVTGVLVSALLSGCKGQNVAIGGKVVSGGKPVPGAAVALEWAENRREVGAATTDDDGEFAIRGQLRDGLHTLYVSAPGHVPFNQPLSYPEQTMIEVQLTPLLELWGVVKLPDDSVASNAVVVLTSTTTKHTHTALANDAGEYWAKDLEPDIYEATVQTPDGLFGILMPGIELNQSRELPFRLKPAKKTIEGADADLPDRRPFFEADPPKWN